MLEEAGESLYSIAAVSKLTGISCHALRVWERRYGFPRPHRSPSGHRRYDAEQVRALRRLAELVRAGGAVGDLVMACRDGTLGLEPAELIPAPRGGSAASALLRALLAGDLAAAEAEFRALARDRGPAELAVEVIGPALVEVGESWFRGECQVYQEHCASGFLRRQLARVLTAAQEANPRPVRRVVVGTVQGDRHEGGAMILAVAMELIGWRALLLGGDLPVREYQRALDGWRPDALAVSFVLSRNINKRFQELSRLRGAPVYVGGRSILNYQGLARRYGLIPVAGPAPEALGLLRDDLEARSGGPGHPPPR